MSQLIASKIYPNSATTGPAAGGYNSLTLQSGAQTIPATGPYPSYVTVNGDGSLTVTAQSFNASVEVLASNITWIGCQFAPTSGFYCVSTVGTPTNHTYQYCQFSAANNVQVLDYGVAGVTGCTFQWCNFFWIAEQPIITEGSNLLVDSCYFHDYTPTAGGHSDPIYLGSTGGPLPMSDITITNNTILARVGAAPYTNNTSCIYFYGSGSNTYDQINISGNLIAGGAYCFYAPSSLVTNMVFQDNYLSTPWFTTSGQFGVFYQEPPWGSGGNVWGSNYWYDGPNGGQLIPEGA